MIDDDDRCATLAEFHTAFKEVQRLAKTIGALAERNHLFAIAAEIDETFSAQLVLRAGKLITEREEQP